MEQMDSDKDVIVMHTKVEIAGRREEKKGGIKREENREIEEIRQTDRQRHKQTKRGTDRQTDVYDLHIFATSHRIKRLFDISLYLYLFNNSLYILHQDDN